MRINHKSVFARNELQINLNTLTFDTWCHIWFKNNVNTALVSHLGIICYWVCGEWTMFHWFQAWSSKCITQGEVTWECVHSVTLIGVSPIALYFTNHSWSVGWIAMDLFCLKIIGLVIETALKSYLASKWVKLTRE